jgi:hypothetical protein
VASLLMQLGIGKSRGLITHAVRYREEPWPDYSCS